MNASSKLTKLEIFELISKAEPVKAKASVINVKIFLDSFTPKKKGKVVVEKDGIKVVLPRKLINGPDKGKGYYTMPSFLAAQVLTAPEPKPRVVKDFFVKPAATQTQLS